MGTVPHGSDDGGFSALIPELTDGLKFEAIQRRLTRLWDYPKFGAPFHKGGRYFFFKNDGLQNQAVLYAQAALTAESAPEPSARNA